MLVIPATSIKRRTFDLKIPYEVTFTADGNYAIPTLESITGDFSTNLKQYLDVVIGPYSPEKSDCDDYVEETTVYARRCHRHSPDAPPLTAVAFGEFWHVDENGEDHGINTFFILKGSDLEMMFFEPQTQRLITLTPNQIELCIYCGF